jgi:hypothetical protein
VRYFGFEREIFVPNEVEVLQESSFELLNRLTKLTFERGSKLRKIGQSALSGCNSLRDIVVPASVIEIEKFAFSHYTGLEDCSIHRDAVLVRIGEKAFSRCCSLRSCDVPKNVEGIGEKCFKGCISLSRLKFGSGQTLTRIVRDGTLDEALDHLGVTEISRLFRIEIREDGAGLAFPGWKGLHSTLAPCI